MPNFAGYKEQRSERKRLSAIENLKKANAANMARPKTYKNCLNCGNAFRLKPREFKRSSYCSKGCMAEHYKSRMTGNSNPNFRNAGNKTCKECGKEYKSYLPNRKYCSRECYNSTPAHLETARRNGMKGGRGGRKDHNQKEIVEALRQGGAAILDLSDIGNGAPDLLVSFSGELYLVEIKNPNTFYGKKGFNKLQQKWSDEWAGRKPIILTSVDEAIKWMNVQRRSMKWKNVPRETVGPL